MVGQFYFELKWGSGEETEFAGPPKAGAWTCKTRQAAM